MVTIFRLFLSCLIALLIPIGSYAADKADHKERLSKHYRLEKPDGAGPFPAVMLVPGCSGFDADFQKEFYDSVKGDVGSKTTYESRKWLDIRIGDRQIIVDNQ